MQYLLNCVPAAQGGPIPELAVDGIVGPKTIAAIRKFQMARFGRADGRVDPGGATIQALQQADPYPYQPLPTGVVAGKWKKGGGAGAGRDGHASCDGIVQPRNDIFKVGPAQMWREFMHRQGLWAETDAIDTSDALPEPGAAVSQGGYSRCR